MVGQLATRTLIVASERKNLMQGCAHMTVQESKQECAIQLQEQSQ